jgi:hypothetical protein
MALRFRLAGSPDVGAIVGLVDSAYRGDASRAGWTTEADLLDAQRLDLIAWYQRRGYRLTGRSRPFPYGDERFGIPRRPDLSFVELAKRLAPGPP